MAQNNGRMKTEKQTADRLVSGFIFKNRLPVAIGTAVVIAAIVIAGTVSLVAGRVRRTGLAAIDTIVRQFTDDSLDISDEEAEARRVAALDALTPFLSRRGVVGVRAELLAAEIAWQRNDAAAAKSHWEAAARADTRAYMAPLAQYNAAVASEMLGELEEAAAGYAAAASAEDFPFAAHAQFSLGRVREAQGAYAAANEAYQLVIDRTPDDTWAHLAKSRQIALQVAGLL
ncbi:MAG: hypothetical protein IJ191_03880 [Treponema sp.]|nr:hypothetical protein [Treponema sp.]